MQTAPASVDAPVQRRGLSEIQITRCASKDERREQVSPTYTRCRDVAADEWPVRNIQRRNERRSVPSRASSAGRGARRGSDVSWILQ
jgi:hypothetical protein